MKHFILSINYLLILLLLFSGCSRDKNKGREVYQFNCNWQFSRIDDNDSDSVEIANQGTDWFAQYNVTHISSEGSLAVSSDKLTNEFLYIDNAEWEDVSLPHAPNIEDLTIVDQWQGISYYRKGFDANPEWKNKKVSLEFEGAMHLADVWINGEHVKQHAGGYTPFVINLSDHLNFGGNNEILVRLDNRNNGLIPPGTPLENLDFCYYGGIYRDVNLTVKNEIHITNVIKADKVAGGGVFVTYPEVSTEKAVVSVQTHVYNGLKEVADVSVRQRLIEIDGLFTDRKMGDEVIVYESSQVLNPQESEHINQFIELDNPNLWSPGEPYLYLLKSEIVYDDEVIDSQEQRIGIRHISFTREDGFVINGEKIRLVGSNRHMEYPYVGNAISNEAQYRDMYHIKESGFNTVRLGHYVQDKSVLEACDELGLLVIQPIPGWQFFNDNDIFVELSYRDTRDMIRRDRNHPSMILWEVILNESWPPEWWKDEVIKVAHNEYPGDQFYTAGDSYGYFGFDVLYNDWEVGFNRPNDSDKPGFIREYYDFEFGGHNSTTRVSREDGQNALLQNAWNAQWSHNRYREYYPWTTGDAVWSMYDYNRGLADDICRSGVADLFRLDKFSVPFFKSQMDIGYPLPSGSFEPYIFLANYWAKPPLDDKVIVYSNVNEVALFINDEKVARQSADDGPSTDYSETEEGWHTGGNPFDGGNSRNLNNAPFTFNNIEWEAGEIKAVGYIDGEVVSKHLVKTPGEPSELVLDYFESGKPASKNDLIIFYVKIKDINETLCVEDASKVNLIIKEGGKIMGPSVVNAEAGIASFIISTDESSHLVVEATSSFDKKQKSMPLKK
ncbi:glycoside hydrolase family 2 TIM barrel-domain containing protein [Marinilabiliaceae bacterium ANBcel2]|nr:glycoside hydrolase family 2 TIM barrel-domain containing protein [Marinilabiliaceae bacterium ANBcel2]